MECLKCGVKVDTTGDICPLCHSHLEKNDGASYPLIKHRLTGSVVKKILLFFTILVSILAVFINTVTTPSINWASFIVAGAISMYIISVGIMKGHRKVLSMMFYMCFLLLAIAILWDKVLGFTGWSINYVLPSLAIGYGVFLLILRFISYFAFRENSGYIYLHVLLEFLPLILYYREVVTFKPLAIISAVFGLVNFLVLILFDTSKLKEDMMKKLHI